jgi:hypothetical protein
VNKICEILLIREHFERFIYFRAKNALRINEKRVLSIDVLTKVDLIFTTNLSTNLCSVFRLRKFGIFWYIKRDLRATVEPLSYGIKGTKNFSRKKEIPVTKRLI